MHVMMHTHHLTASFPQQANEETFLVVQIETIEAVENVDAIAAVNGVDGLFVGPGEANHDRRFDVDACRRLDDSPRHIVAAGNPPENIDQL